MLRLKTFPQLAAVLVIILGVLALGGWILDVQTLKTVLPGLVSMKVNTAICFVLAGLSLLLQTGPEEPISGKRMGAARVASGLVLGVGLLTLVEYASKREFGIDQIFIRESAAEAGLSFPGRMSPASALNFVLLGISLTWLDTSIGRWPRWPAQECTFAAGVITMVAFIGYFYGVETLYQIVPYSTIALHTVIASWLLCLGILLARPTRGAMVLFTSDRPGSVMVRRILPTAIIVVLVTGWLRVIGQRAGFFGLGFGSALFVTVLILIVALLAAWVARELNRVDAARERDAEALQKSSARLDGIISSAMDAIVSVDGRQRIVVFNPAAEAMFHIKAAVALNHSIDRFIPKSLSAIHERNIEEFAKTGVSTRQMGALGAVKGVRSNGEEFPIEASISQVEVSGEKLFTVILRDITERRRVEEQLQASREELRALAARLQAVREEERTRVAREIHDVLAQELTRLKVDIVWLRRRLNQGGSEGQLGPIQDRLAEMTNLTDTAIVSVQKIATELRPVVLDTLGLSAAIEWQANEFAARTGIKCEVNLPGEDLELDRDRSTALFRILQESLTNVVRHAQATKVEIDLRHQAGQIVLSVRDNGRGIVPTELNDPNSLGLVGMRERAILLGGVCQITGGPSLGTEVEARLPSGPEAKA
jgi:PAS domain S-box-containing protein